jgi:hypothetical protein
MAEFGNESPENFQPLYRLFHPFTQLARKKRKIVGAELIRSPLNQQLHYDFDPRHVLNFNERNKKWYENKVPFSLIYSAKESLIQIVVDNNLPAIDVTLPANSLLIFPCPTAHGGAAYNEENFRFFAKFIPDDFLLEAD